MDTYVSPAEPQAPRPASSAKPSKIFGVRQNDSRRAEAGGRNQRQAK